MRNEMGEVLQDQDETVEDIEDETVSEDEKIEEESLQKSMSSKSATSLDEDINSEKN
jgi:hypothetical protein